MSRKFGVACLVFLFAAASMATATAAPCTGNNWQPTFVHDLERPDGPYYVDGRGSFIKLPGNSAATWVPEACRLISGQGLRDRRGFTSCQDYTRVQCGCTRSDRSNTTCSAFLATRP